MGLLTKSKTWADNEAVNYTDINADFDTLYTGINGNIENANVKSDAAITESKIAFDATSGHDHVTTGKPIAKVFAVSIAGTLTTGASQTPAIIVTQAQTITKAYAKVKTAPTGASILIDINKNGTSIWNTTQANRLTIAASATYGTQTSFDTTSLAEGDILTFDLDQVGSSVSGADLTIELK